jgi:hypothetical protein
MPPETSHSAPTGFVRVSPQAANIERARFAVLGLVINAIDAGASAHGLTVTCPLRRSRFTRPHQSDLSAHLSTSDSLHMARNDDVKTRRTHWRRVGGTKGFLRNACGIFS